MQPVQGTRALVYDARRLVAEGLASLLPDGRTIASARAVSSLDGVSDSLAAFAADVVIVAASSPADGVLEVVRHVRATSAVAAVLVVTDDDRAAFLQRVAQQRVAAVLPLTSSTQRSLRIAVSEVAAGKRCYVPASGTGAHPLPNPLNDREIDVLRLAARGMSSLQIAGTVHFSRGTVRNYLSAAIRKMGVNNRIEASRLASERGWV